MQFLIDSGWLDTYQMLDAGYLEIVGMENAATQFELEHSSINSYYIKTYKKNKNKSFTLIFDRETLKKKYQTYLTLLDNNNYIISFKYMRDDYYISFTEKMLKFLSSKPYKEISILFTGQTIYFNKDLAINYSIYHNGINPRFYDIIDASVGKEDKSSVYLYSNSLVEPISIDERYGVCKYFDLPDYDVFCADKDYDIGLRKLLGEFYAVIGVNSSIKQDIVGISHYSRCFNLNYFLPPLNFMGTSERINEFRELMCLSNGLTLKNVLMLLNSNVLKLSNIKKYKLIIPNPDFLGEEIIINTIDNGKRRKIEMGEEYTLQSQYVNHPHYL